MSLISRTGFAVVGAPTLMCSATASAQGYPVKPIRLLVGLNLPLHRNMPPASAADYVKWKEVIGDTST